MAVTGLLLIGFIVGHAAGNLKMFEGADAITGIYHIDTYAEALRRIGGDLLGEMRFLWAVRVGLFVCLILHVVSAVLLTRGSQAARPIGYAKVSHRSATLASRSMAVGGVIIALFIVFHILHFTTGSLHFAGFREGAVYANVYAGFSTWYTVIIYLVALTAVSLHLYHGAWSCFQTLGLDSPGRNLFLRQGAKILAVAIWVAFISVPLGVYLGFLSPPAHVAAQ